MLAYVFWHWRRGDVPPDRYEELQRRFHAVLQAAGVQIGATYPAPIVDLAESRRAALAAYQSL